MLGRVHPSTTGWLKRDPKQTTLQYGSQRVRRMDERIVYESQLCRSLTPQKLDDTPIWKEKMFYFLRIRVGPFLFSLKAPLFPHIAILVDFLINGQGQIKSNTDPRPILSFNVYLCPNHISSLSCISTDLGRRRDEEHGFKWICSRSIYE